MSITAELTTADTGPGPSRISALPDRCIVAVVLEHRGRIALFKRSPLVRHDRRLWHCISGFVERGTSPQQQVLDELFEECGLEARDIRALRQGPVLMLTDDFGGAPWLVHTFRAVSGRSRLRTNWEHEKYSWTRPEKIGCFFNRVGWLDTVLDATDHLKTSSRQETHKMRAFSAG